MIEPFVSSSDHLAAELRWLGLLVHRAVLAWRAQTGGSSQPELFKGLYLSDAEIDQLLRGAPPADDPAIVTLDARADQLRRDIDARVEASTAQRVPLTVPLVRRIFGLSALETRIFVLALAVELDLDFERYFAYLQDDLSRKRPSADLAMRLLCRTPEDRAGARAALAPPAPLLRFGLLQPLEGQPGPWPGRPLVAGEQALSFVVGTAPHLPSVSLLPALRSLASLRWSDTVKTQLASLLSEYVRRDGPGDRRLAIHLEGPAGAGKRTLAAALCEHVGIPLLCADARELLRASGDALRDVFRQAVFAQGAVYLDHAGVFSPPDVRPGEDGRPERDSRPGADAAEATRLLRALDELGWVTFLATTEPWSPLELRARLQWIRIELPGPDIGARERLWSELAREAGVPAPAGGFGDLAARFRLVPGEITTALLAARDTAVLLSEPVTTAALVASCRAQSGLRLGRLARKVRGRRGWPDLTLPENTLAQLHEICAQLRHRKTVLEEWGFGERLGLGSGLSALFHGPSGVGKTMAVEVMANDLGLDAYKIDLSVVVSKYIGETERNLARVFDAAESTNAILFFDEADALFGKRSEVKDAHDRYANIEISYLLQRLEEFDGLVVLASNFRKNIDDAFYRRMQFLVEFPMPEPTHRYRIWKQHVPERAPLDADVDLGFLASRFALSGGNIRNIVLNAAYLAAHEGGLIRMKHLIHATRREYEKMGRLCTDADFAPREPATRNGS